MSLLVKSVAAANALPATAKVMNYCLYGPNATARLRNLGMEFTVWVFKHAAVWQLRTLAPVVMKRLMGELGGDTEAGDAMQVGGQGGAATWDVGVFCCAAGGMVWKPANKQRCVQNRTP